MIAKTENSKGTQSYVGSNGGNSARRDPEGGSKKVRIGMGKGWRNRGS